MNGSSISETLDILHGYGTQIIWKSASDPGQADVVNSDLRLARQKFPLRMNCVSARWASLGDRR